MSLPDILSAIALVAALFFFTAGTVGLVRLPDVHSRLHALTKADNVGLGFTVLACIFLAEHWTTVFKLVLIWLLVLASGATVSYLIAQRALPEDEIIEEEEQR